VAPPASTAADELSQRRASLWSKSQFAGGGALRVRDARASQASSDQSHLKAKRLSISHRAIRSESLNCRKGTSAFVGAFISSAPNPGIRKGY